MQGLGIHIRKVGGIDLVKKAFIRGTLILFSANLFNRIIAFVYQYLIMSWVGAESYGIYQMVFPTYMMALVLTTAGLPLAVSKMVSEQVAIGNRATAQKTFRIALTLLLCSGLIVSVLVFFVMPYLSGPLFPDPRVLPVFLVCIPAIFVVAACSAFRGYFQGLQQMSPTALAQVFEQITRIGIGITLSVKLLPYGVEYGAVGLATGMVVGEVVGFLVVLWFYRKHRKQSSFQQDAPIPSILHLMKRLFTLGLPITAGRLIQSGASTADSILIPLRLQVAGYSMREAATLYGQLGGAAFTLITFPSVFTMSLATSLVPAISEATAKKHFGTVQYRIAEALRFTVLIGTPFLVFLYFFAPELTDIFKSPNAAGVLSTLAIGGLFLYLQSTTSGILQGLGYPQIPVLHSVIASPIKLILIYYLTAMPNLGLVGTAWAFNFAFFLVSLLNLIAIAYKGGFTIELEKLFLQPLAAGMVMAAAIYFTRNRLPLDSVPLLLISEFSLGALVYLATLFFNSGLTRQDIKRIPFIGRIISF
jgi:stage V sporulation protein B